MGSEDEKSQLGLPMTDRKYVISKHAVEISLKPFPRIVGHEKVASKSSNKLHRSQSPLDYKGSDYRVEEKYFVWPILKDIKEKKTLIFRKETKAFTSWDDFNKKISMICSKVRSLFHSESRVISVKSPAKVFGDIHGNLHDLLNFEKGFWWTGCPSFHEGSLVFLGDYVDRGLNSFETIIYLFIMKILSPEKVWLLRGNHEVRSTNAEYGLKVELSLKFGEVGLDDKIYKMLNETFDLMPLAAVIDRQIFCCHGGVPSAPNSRQPVKISDIKSIPRNLSDPKQMSQIAWELMWNDPIEDNEFEEFVKNPYYIDEQTKARRKLYVDAEAGFVESVKRSTGKGFTMNATEAFLEVNNLTSIIRAHEMCDGYRLTHDDKILTVFSASRYVGAANRAGFAMVENKKIRPFRLSND